MSDALLPCPFCGFTPVAEDADCIYPVGRDRTVWKLVCYETAGGCSAHMLGSSPSDCIEKWNRRAQSDAPAPLPADAPRYTGVDLASGPDRTAYWPTAPARDALVDDAERALFERTLMAHLSEGRAPGDLDHPAGFWLDRLDDGRYEYSRVDDAWLGWRLAASLARKQST